MECFSIFSIYLFVVIYIKNMLFKTLLNMTIKFLWDVANPK